MSVIVELSLPADEFELGRILSLEGDDSIVLETMVPLGERTVPFFRHFDGTHDGFEAEVGDHPAVSDIQVVQTSDGETLYALDWAVTTDAFLDGVQTYDGQILSATGSRDVWSFELRFRSHDSLSGFQEWCTEADIQHEVDRKFNPTRPEAGPWYGLTPPQRTALIRAIERGYYEIPRGVSTVELADEFDISDQALTERLRRGIVALVTNTLLVSDDDGD